MLHSVFISIPQVASTAPGGVEKPQHAWRLSTHAVDRSSERLSRFRGTTVCASVRDPFDRLGVAPNSTKESIRKAYRKLVLRVHPDLHPDSDDREFIQIQEAYETLIANKGKPQPRPTNGQESWSFHDWHWKFRMSRAFDQQQHKSGSSDPYASTDRVRLADKHQVRTQLQGLRRKARFRSSRKAESSAHSQASHQQSTTAPVNQPSTTELNRARKPNVKPDVSPQSPMHSSAKQSRAPEAAAACPSASKSFIAPENERYHRSRGSFDNRSTTDNSSSSSSSSSIGSAIGRCDSFYEPIETAAGIGTTCVEADTNQLQQRQTTATAAAAVAAAVAAKHCLDQTAGSADVHDGGSHSQAAKTNSFVKASTDGQGHAAGRSEISPMHFSRDSKSCTPVSMTSRRPSTDVAGCSIEVIDKVSTSDRRVQPSCNSGTHLASNESPGHTRGYLHASCQPETASTEPGPLSIESPWQPKQSSAYIGPNDMQKSARQGTEAVHAGSESIMTVTSGAEADSEDSEQEIGYRGSGHVRSQLAGLRRKNRLYNKQTAL